MVGKAKKQSSLIDRCEKGGALLGSEECPKIDYLFCGFKTMSNMGKKKLKPRRKKGSLKNKAIDSQFIMFSHTFCVHDHHV